MLNQQIVAQDIGPGGQYGSVSVGFVEGKLNAGLSISLKGILNAVADKIGGAWATSAATFIESAVGLG